MLFPTITIFLQLDHDPLMLISSKQISNSDNNIYVDHNDHAVRDVLTGAPGGPARPLSNDDKFILSEDDITSLFTLESPVSEV